MGTPFEIGAMLLATFIAWSMQTQRAEPNPTNQQPATVTVAPFGRMPDGKAVEVYTLTNVRGMEVRAITYCAIIQSIRVLDRAGA